MAYVKSLIENDELFFDSAIVSHGYAPFMRDYDIVIARPAPVPAASDSYIDGRYRCRFTHCSEVCIKSTLTDEAWQQSLGGRLHRLPSMGDGWCPAGVRLGRMLSDAYPGLSYVNDSPLAASWTKRLGRDMHEVSVESNAFVLRLVCHDLHVDKIAQGDPSTRQLTSLDPEQCV